MADAVLFKADLNINRPVLLNQGLPVKSTNKVPKQPPGFNPELVKGEGAGALPPQPPPSPPPVLLETKICFPSFDVPSRVLRFFY
ncbi:hypothetical protein M5689_020988 [Euphorbia peplus]|nr:hypothetical protein M5689_020988 [Euphorbia peplus]